MELGNLLNQNIRIEKYVSELGTTISIINNCNDMELAKFKSNEDIDCWINPGWFKNEMEYLNHKGKQNEK